jgi:Na+-transporting methylmalonyl-CoA/oxaloacetate decarboxylase gamma subunit
MKPLLTSIYKKSFWSTYDNIGKLILVNLLWFCIFPLPTYLCFRYLPVEGLTRLLITIVVGLITHSYAASGVFGVTSRLADYKETDLGRFFDEAGAFFLRTLTLSLIYGIVFYLLFYGIRFYIKIKVAGGVLGFFLAGWQVCIFAFCLLVQTYLLPLLVSKNWGVLKTMKWAAILTTLKPGLTALLFLQALALFVLLSITGVGAVLLVLSIVAVFLNTATREAWREVEARWKPRKKPASWKEIFEERDLEEEEKRTLKDILRPWDV